MGLLMPVTPGAAPCCFPITREEELKPFKIMWGPRTILFLFDEQDTKVNNCIMCELVQKHPCCGVSNLSGARTPNSGQQ